MTVGELQKALARVGSKKEVKFCVYANPAVVDPVYNSEGIIDTICEYPNHVSLIGIISKGGEND